MTLSTLVFYEHVCDDECSTGEEYGNFLTVHFVTHLAQPVSSASRPNAGEQHPGRQHNYLEGDSCVFTAKYRIRSNQSMIIVLLKPDKSSHSLKRFRPMTLLYRNFQLMEQTLLETVISREQASFEPNQIPAIKCSRSQSKLKSDFGETSKLVRLLSGSYPCTIQRDATGNFSNWPVLRIAKQWRDSRLTPWQTDNLTHIDRVSNSKIYNCIRRLRSGIYSAQHM